MSDPRNFKVSGKTSEVPPEAKAKVRGSIISLMDDGIENNNPFMFVHMNDHETCVIFGGANDDHILEMVRAILLKLEDYTTAK